MPRGSAKSKGPVTYGDERVAAGPKVVKQRYSGGSTGTGGRAADWAAVDAATLLGAVEAVTAAGDALILGCTSDGGAYAITILTDGGRPRYWPATAEACEAQLLAITLEARAAADGD